MPHETRNERDRLVVIVQEFKGAILLVIELDTSDAHGSLAPSVALEHLLLDFVSSVLLLAGQVSIRGQQFIGSRTKGAKDGRRLRVLPR
jgi:hypothetical protein